MTYGYPKSLIDQFIEDYPECEGYFSFFSKATYNYNGKWIDIYWTEDNADYGLWLKTDPDEDDDEVTFGDMFGYERIILGSPVTSGGASGDWIPT